ncbi:short-chain dehydrogenase/reductase SDR [Histoplasma capsulatum]|uniref:Short-chain dehydrogenase/reductase SDR n=1 Tax=Ajellomyces capsulatus TaxID=5037 RepID=A0A8A1MJH9_AJECA|nr:short-chain dehydrogenase/reductase SDR [Histoplasma capsulatum]
MAPQDRIAQVSSHLNYPQGLLAGQIAIITGAGQGVGAEAARLFANEGAKVVVADLDAKKAEAVVKSINDASPGRAIAVVGDVTDPTYVKRVVQKAAEFGNGKIHIIVNNAGYTWDGVIHKVRDTAPLQGYLSDKQWEAMIAVHATAPFKLVQAAAPYFRVKDGADRVIVNISSTSGIHGNPGQVNYAVGKAGMVGLTKTIAKEWGPQFGVRANTIAFGLVLTRLTAAKEAGAFITTPDGEKVVLGIPSAQLAARAGSDEKDKYPDIPLRRVATPTEAARSILAVVSPLLSYVNGQTIMVTGGRNM